MSTLEMIQDTWLSRAISGSTWGYPIVGALHVLAIAVFAGAVLRPNLSALMSPRRDSGGEAGFLETIGFVTVVLTGALLFASGAVRYAGSTGFRVKMALLVLILVNATLASRSPRSRLHAGIALVLWAGVIFAARGIAFF